MFKFKFKGGIHPDHKKEDTRYLKIEELKPPKKLYLPITQHIGQPNEPLVKKGDFVKMGQPLAESTGFVSVPLHAPVSGVVDDIGTVMHPTGVMVPAIILQNNGMDMIDETIAPKGSLESLSSVDIISIVRDAGIVGMGGASFPTHVKLSPPSDRTIDCCIINGAECEPYMTSDHRVMLETPDKVIFGLKVIMKVLNLEKGIIAIENNKKDAYATIKAYAKKDKNIQVVLLETKYPQGSEKHLIKSVTGRSVPSGKLPMDVGIVVNNIDTCVAICNALQTGMPLISRVVTVSGSCFSKHANYRVRIGTPVRHIIKTVGGFCEEPAKLIIGGPMMGVSIFSEDVPILKNSGALLALSEKDVQVGRDTPCLRCGKCVDACPMNLLPPMLDQYAQKGDLEMLQKMHVSDCIECGACSFLCPGKRHPVQNIRVAKQKIIATAKRGEK